jgi:hypothetical protein
MCVPAGVIAGAALVIGAGKEIAAASAQNKASKANAANAQAAMQETWKDLSLQQSQQEDSTATTIMQTDRAAQKADALARVSAGEAGVAGASVDAIVGDISSQASAADVTNRRNLAMTIDRLQREKVGAGITEQNRINAVPPANPFATGLAIAGHVVDYATSRIKAKP